MVAHGVVALLLTAWIAMPAARLSAQDALAPLPEVQWQVSHLREADRVRVDAASRESVARLSEWLGPSPHRLITITDAQTEQAPDQVVVAPPLWSSPASMEIESQVAFALAQQWWPQHAGAERDAMNAGIAWYLQSRIVERVFDLKFLADGYSLESSRFFGGTLPWSYRLLRLNRWTAGVARDRFLARVPASDSSRRLPPGIDASVARAAVAFATLERHLGWPALQGALRALADRHRANQLPPPAFATALGDAVGQDLSWFFSSAFTPAVNYDYAVVRLSSEPLSEPCSGVTSQCIRSVIEVERIGEGVFSGRSAPAIGGYESGDAIALEVTFADGQIATTRWDGRAAVRRFEFDGPSPVAHAEIDPEGVLKLDVNPLNNRKSVSPQSNVPVTKWVAQWLVWLQLAALTYGVAI